MPLGLQNFAGVLVSLPEAERALIRRIARLARERRGQQEQEQDAADRLQGCVKTLKT